ncbi:MAG: hypothetical protein FWE80_01710 [Oscillospiraceae bacterium]|nr:hypothetical protein [Oscillospiraceae bacterium]
MDFFVDINKPWYHGSPLKLDMLKEGSTITQWKELAEAFAAKPSRLEYREIFSPITHNGIEKGYLYLIDELINVEVDIVQHPRTTMDKGVEFLTKRPLKLKQIV